MTTTEKNKLIAEFIGYYQPKEVKDDLHSFEVYASKRNAKKDYPKDNIITYYGSDIEDFTFIDKPKYHSSWDWLMPVVEKIESLGYEVKIGRINSQVHEILNEKNPIFSLVCGDISKKIELVYDVCVKFIQWHNQNKRD